MIVSGGVVSVFHNAAGAERHADADLSGVQKMRKPNASAPCRRVLCAVFRVHGGRAADFRRPLGNGYHRIDSSERGAVSAVWRRGGVFRSEKENEA